MILYWGSFKEGVLSSVFPTTAPWLSRTPNPFRGSMRHMVMRLRPLFAFSSASRRENVQFPNKVSYFEGAEDLPGDKDKGVLRLKNGQMVVVYKTDDPHWWLGKVSALRRV